MSFLRAWLSATAKRPENLCLLKTYVEKLLSDFCRVTLFCNLKLLKVSRDLTVIPEHPVFVY